ncbi:putative membrane protein [Neobacillus bataviensis]|uniref:Putative membrane protein n=1 Tax=Neobacillus bataviensis TaxID=220685 RepID=A0A561DXL4_9BACI|nr:TIGR03943 family protein [Neobacillus bataviensis]TWE08101.1 putative membrane protein [Neobacillus bataviensis]
MQLHIQQAFRAFILLTFSTLLFKLHYTRDISRFINPKYEVLSQIASIIFLILFFIQVTRVWSARENLHHNCHHDDHSCHHDHGDAPLNTKIMIAYLVIIFPLLTGFLLSPKVLDSSIADKKGAMLIVSKQNQASQVEKNKLSGESSPKKKELSGYESPIRSINLKNQREISVEEYNELVKQLEQKKTIEMNDYVYAAYYDEIGMDVGKYKGKKIKLKGFVYKEKELSKNQLVISRFLITHCVADASIIGFLSEVSKDPALENDTWIEAEGVLDVTSYNGTELPLIKIIDWKIINEPEKPYLYPINIKIM